jgi:hypothetical protein
MCSDPRGPLVKIVAVEEPTYEKPRVTLTLSCGHTTEPNPIYHYKVGADYRCFKCKQQSEPK